ncbi:MAG TPA: hypothetical protein PKI16_01765 [Candidatus Dojkabacteria bacterium]|nr:hypothetical protein [Candidatus Dojkabacteria bacterium]
MIIFIDESGDLGILERIFGKKRPSPYSRASLETHTYKASVQKPSLFICIISTYGI